MNTRTMVLAVVLCGAMFGLATYRHRIFESNVPLAVPMHPKHATPTSKAGHWKPGTLISVAGNCAPMRMAREAMGIDWTTRAERVESSAFMGNDANFWKNFCELRLC